MVEHTCEMAMLIVVVEVQYLVGVRYSLGELARITVAKVGKSVPRYQQVDIAGGLRDVQNLRHPGQ